MLVSASRDRRRAKVTIITAITRCPTPGEAGFFGNRGFVLAVQSHEIACVGRPTPRSAPFVLGCVDVAARERIGGARALDVAEAERGLALGECVALGDRVVIL